MRTFFIAITLFFISELTHSAQWIELSASDIDNIQILQPNNSAGASEGLYIGLKTEITGEAASYCSRKNAIAIKDEKLTDRTYSGILFAISTQKKFGFYVDGSGNCLSNIPVASAFLLKP